MLQRTTVRLYVLLAVLGLAVGCFAHAQDDNGHRGRKYKAPPPAARIEVTVLNALNSKPVEHAAVIFHPIEGDKDKGGMELKTNEDGKVLIDVIPMGDTVRMQVVASGFQTYGSDYKVDKLEIAKEVRLNRPGQQYSIYKNGNSSAKDSGNGADKNANPPNGQKPDGSGSQQQKQPDQNQPQPK